MGKRRHHDVTPSCEPNKRHAKVSCTLQQECQRYHGERETCVTFLPPQRPTMSSAYCSTEPISSSITGLGTSACCRAERRCPATTANWRGVICRPRCAVRK